MNEKFERLVERAEQLIARIESVLPQPLQAPADWDAALHQAARDVTQCRRLF